MDVSQEPVIPEGFGWWPGSNKLIVPKKNLDEELERIRKARELARERRRTMYGQFFSDWNKLTGLTMTGAMDKPANEVSFSFLRDAFERSAIDQIIVNARLMQVKQVARRSLDPYTQPGFKVVHERHFEPDFQETEDIKRRCRECEEVILNPNKAIHPSGFKDFMMAAVREELIIDRKAMIIFRDRVGRPAKYHLIDGSTIKPRMEVLMPWLKKNFDKYTKDVKFEDFIYNMNATSQAMEWAAQAASEDKNFNPMGIDLTKAAYVQEIDSHIVAGWTEDEISIDITNPSIQINKLAYGQGSLFQQSLEVTAAWINAWTYNEELFRTNYPESMLLLFGDYDPNGLEAFKREMYGEAGQAAWQRLAILPADPDYKAELVKLRDAPKDMLFDSLLHFIINLKCASYRMHPSTINFSVDRNGSNYLFEGNQNQTIELAQEEGFQTILQNMADWLTRALVKPRYDDLRVIWVGLQKEDEREKIEILEKKVTHWMTIDEARQAENLDPLPNGAGKLPANPTVLQIAQIAQMQAQQEKQVEKSRKRLKIWVK